MPYSRLESFLARSVNCLQLCRCPIAKFIDLLKRHPPVVTYISHGRRQVKICGVDRHGESGVRAYNGGLEAE